MENEHLTGEVPTIKDQLLDRFMVARVKLGKRWRKQLIGAYPEYDNFEGSLIMKSLADAASNRTRRGEVEKIKRAVLALEKLADIPHAPIL